MEKIDYKKAEKHLYLPKAPAIVEVPEMVFFAVDGQGDPNTSPAYQEALSILYGLSFTVKMSRMGGGAPEGYFDYVVPPLEGLWWTDAPGFDGLSLCQGGPGQEEAGAGPHPGPVLAVAGGAVRPCAPCGPL